LTPGDGKKIYVPIQNTSILVEIIRVAPNWIFNFFTSLCNRSYATAACGIVSKKMQQGVTMNISSLECMLRLCANKVKEIE
jgi:hypothetical protein